MNKSYLFIQPLDTLFFRSGKPFGKGEEAFVDSSMIIPYPSVIWGALFTSLCINSGDERLQKFSIKDEDLQKLQVHHVYLHNPVLSKTLIPAPLDLFVDDKREFFFIEKYINNPLSNVPFSTLVKPSIKDAEREENLFISVEDLFESYTARQNHRTTVYTPDDFSTKNPKVGIALSKTSRTTVNEQFYKVEMVEFAENWGFLVEYESDYAFDNGIIKLGGEGKLASFKKVEQPNIPVPSTDIEQVKYVKVYIQSPTFWESGDGIEELNNIDGFELVSASIGKYLSVGGFDVNKKVPKPMKKAVPAGSIYLFKKLNHNSDLADNIKTLIAKNTANSNGFGKFQVIPFKTN